jgi:hypothetical protein
VPPTPRRTAGEDHVRVDAAPQQRHPRRIGPEIAVVVFASVWPVLINTVYGVRSVSPLATETLRAFGFGPLGVKAGQTRRRG